MCSVFVRWPLLRISVILQLLGSLWAQHTYSTDSALPSRMYKAMAHAGSPSKRGRCKERNSMRVSPLKSCRWSLWATGGVHCLRFAFLQSVLLYSLCPSTVPSMASPPPSGTARSLLWRACSCRTPVYRGRQHGCILETVPRICISRCLARAAYPREAKDVNLESLQRRRAAVPLAGADAGQQGPGHSEGDAHGM